MQPVITAFAQSPDRGQGLARDTRVRWAFEEVGQPYDVRLVSFQAMKEAAHLALNPFGQIPTYEEGTLALFETGAITVEPPILELANAQLLEGDRSWTRERLPLVWDRIRTRLRQLSARLGSSSWLDGEFSAGDLMMIHVLQRLRPSGLLEEYANLAAYVARGEARPAYQRAYAAQYAVFASIH